MTRMKVFWRSFGSTWYRKEEFAKKQLKLKWHLVSRDVENIGVKYNEQRILLREDEEIKEANVYVYMILLLKASGQMVFEDASIFTRNIVKFQVLYLGWYKKRIQMDRIHPNYIPQGIGIVPARKPNRPRRRFSGR